MDIEELEPRKRKTFEIGEDLSARSVEELQELAQSLRDEIYRIEKVLESKQSSRQAADEFFKS
jgi:uncharacterized small protein (DUF1192 family)